MILQVTEWFAILRFVFLFIGYFNSLTICLIWLTFKPFALTEHSRINDQSKRFKSQAPFRCRDFQREEDAISPMCVADTKWPTNTNTNTNTSGQEKKLQYHQCVWLTPNDRHTKLGIKFFSHFSSPNIWRWKVKLYKYI